jgi:hypothetical protein
VVAGLVLGTTPLKPKEGLMGHPRQALFKGVLPFQKMNRLGKRLAYILGAIILVPLVLFAVLSLYLTAKDVPSKVADFRPTAFTAKADTEFFYSIDNELKYSDLLDSRAPTIMRGQIKNFLVAPDNKKIAIVADGILKVVRTDKPIIRQIAPVGSIYKEPKPIGRSFYRDDDFQWSRDSKTLYLIRDEYCESKGSQLYSIKGELWKYEIESESLQLVLKPFQAHSYFFGRAAGIYYSVPTESGDLQLKYFEGSHISDVDESNARNITRESLGRGFEESPFYSFSIFDYQHVERSKGVGWTFDGKNGPTKLVIKGKIFLALTQGEGFKGSYYCYEMLGSIFLPGNRYFLLNLPHCGNYNGQLLIDTATVKYQTLPANSVVYSHIEYRHLS